nr:PREDICTED: zinc finger SWIM domain-containing protein 8 [Bemisia tabaci]
MLDPWADTDNDRFSFEDSDRFEDDSLCSWSTEPESLCNNWRGWKKQSVGPASVFGSTKKPANEKAFQVPPLCELAAFCVASHIPFELVEQVYPPVPEQLQLRIAFWSFPDNEEDIRLYSCLANSSADEFQRGEQLFKAKAVKDPLQIGFHLSASVHTHNASQIKYQFVVAITFDRRRITSCTCTCNSSAYWCSHIVAVCLHRIHWPNQVTLRAPVSESLSRLQRDQLQKFAQYLISELPQQILPTAQRILDELLSPHPSVINSVSGAPDPTAGASANEQTAWYLDEKTLHDNINKILIKFCVPAPIVFSDVNYLSNTAPPAASEWTSLLRPLRGREPEGMWNLLSIVREMFKRNDCNALPLLEIITEECVAIEQILVWWFSTKVALQGGSLSSGGHGGGKHSSMNSNSHSMQHACASLCDEIVILWRLAALNPGISPTERSLLQAQFKQWHIKALDKVMKNKMLNTSNSKSGSSHNNWRVDSEVFSGFKPAVEACFLDWEDYQIPGITYNDVSCGGAWLYTTQPFTACFKHSESASRTDHIVFNPVSSSQIVLHCDHHPRHQHDSRGNHHHHHGFHVRPSRSQKQPLPESFPYCGTSRTDMSPSDLISYDHPLSVTQGLRLMSRMNDLANLTNVAGINNSNDGDNRSSVSSEGFCENNGPDTPPPVDASDSQDGGGSDSSSSSAHLRHAKSKNISSSSTSNNRSGDESDYSMKNIQLPSSSKDTPSTSKTDDQSLKKDDVFIETTQPSTTAPVVTATTSNATPENGDKRRLSKDDSISSSNSDSQQSNENDYAMYLYDPKSYDTAKATTSASKKDAKPEISETAFTNLKLPTDPWDILFARAEGLHAHGHAAEACILGVRLAEQLLTNPPDLMIELPPTQTKGKRKKVNPISHQLSMLASDTLAKCAFLCSVLAENHEHFHLAFKVGLFGLEMPRPPATTKPLEVKMAHQESELVGLLKRIPLGQSELDIIRDRAQKLQSGVLKSRGEALLPLMLATFIIETLVISGPTRQFSRNLRLPTDENLGFEAAVAAIGLKANVSEADHPLLCEGTRRQRGELAITLLTYYKDDQNKLARIMDKLLDREVHQLIKTPVPSWYYSNNPTARSMSSRSRHESTRASNPANFALNEVNHLLDSNLASHDCQPGFSGNMNSRRHSLTSGDLDMNLELGLGSLTLNGPAPGIACSPQAVPCVTPAVPTTPTTTTTTRSKEMRFKGKRAYPSIPNQPSEAGAHFTLELAKSILLKAGGNSSTSLFTQAPSSHPHLGPHRALQMCAFQLGLYGLGLHNCVSPNWLSRTYSSHVSWLSGQAIEIGAPAIMFLIDTWEGHLTPTEAVSIADRASRNIDANVVRAAAELALSCLPHSPALSPAEIHRAVLQCKEQSKAALEAACLTVENAGKGGGVYPEVLFTVARHWYELYLQTLKDKRSMSHEPEVLEEAAQDPMEHMNQAQNPMVHHSPPPPPPPPPIQPAYYPVEQLSPFTVATPYGLTAFQPVQYVRHTRHTHHPHMAMRPPPAAIYVPPTAITYRPHAANQPVASGCIPVTSVGQSAPPLQYFVPSGHHILPPSLPQFEPQPVTNSSPQSMMMLTSANGQPPNQQMVPQPQLKPQRFSQTQLRYLLSAYRVGMLALETLSRRVHDDRPISKYARNPPYSEDIKWLFNVSTELGSQYVLKFCFSAVNSVVSPFILHEVAFEAAQYLSRNNHALYIQHLRSTLAPLMQKCQQMYIQCMHQQLYHLGPNEYEDFINIILTARAAFQITPDASMQFKEWLQSIRRSKSCKKELWTQLNAALMTSGK